MRVTVALLVVAVVALVVVTIANGRDAPVTGEQMSTSLRLEPGGGPSALRRIAIGFSELVISVILGVLILWASLVALERLIGTLDQEAELGRGNVAAGLMLSSSLLGVVILIRRTLYPISSVLQAALLAPQLGVWVVVKTLLYSVSYVVLALAIAVVTVALAARLFTKLTRSIDEVAAIRANNVAVGIFYSGVIVGLCLFIEEGLHALLITLIPGPQVNIL